MPVASMTPTPVVAVPEGTRGSSRGVGGRLRAGSGRWMAYGRWVRAKTLGRRSARAAAAARRAAVVELCDLLAAELQAGKAPRQALEVLARPAREGPAPVSALTAELAPVLATSRLDGDVAAAMRAVTVPGAGGLTRLAAAWEVAEGSGAALADLLDRIGRGLRADESLRREVAGQLAAPRATARLLVGLPVFGLALGSATGMDPLTVLVTTPYGWACLGAGTVLAGLGVWWVERLAAGVERYAGGDR